MSSTPPLDFALSDLQLWIDQAVCALQATQPAQGGQVEDVRHNFVFDMALAAGICKAIPEADFVIAGAHAIQGGPTPPRIFVARIGDRVFHRDRFVALDEVVKLGVAAYRDDLLALVRPIPELASYVQPLRGSEMDGFTQGTWPLFLGEQIASRRKAHQEACLLCEQTSTPSQAGSGRPRI